jgi:hypothetical protein
LGIVKSLADNDYEAGLRLNEHARNITTHPSGIVYVLGMSSALLGLGRYAEAASYAKIWLDIGEGARKIGPIALIALAMARTRQYDYAAELLGFVDNYRAMNGWMERWSLVRDVLDELHDHLGMDGYQVAFERGKGLDLDTVLRSLPDEF